jgi:hypothetical protein
LKGKIDMKRCKVDTASCLMMMTMLCATIIAPNGESSSCDKLWCIVLVKSCFGIMAYLFFDLAFFIATPLQRLACKFIFGNKFYDEYMEEYVRINKA